jgi:DNA polymerase-1
MAWETMLKNWDDTPLITYLANEQLCWGTNSAWKEQAQEYAGNWATAPDIEDITKIPLDKLLKYNLIDGLSTQYVC